MKKYLISFVLTFSFSVQLFQTESLYAQTASTDQSAQLKPFTGKYQFTDNKNALFQILVKNGQLVLRQLWNNEDFAFNQTSPLEFYNDEHDFRLKFTKNEKGEITRALAFGRDTWNRVPDSYMPAAQKIIKLSMEQLKPFEGKYTLKEGDRSVEVVTADGRLVMKSEQKDANIWPVSETDFVTDDQTYLVKFSKAADGSITQATVNNNDVWLKVK